MSDKLREMAARWFAKAHQLEESRCFPAGFERRMCANELIRELDSRLDDGTTRCAWIRDEDGIWYGECGNTWEFTWDGPVENQMNYCPRCGGKVEARQ